MHFHPSPTNLLIMNITEVFEFVSKLHLSWLVVTPRLHWYRTLTPPRLQQSQSQTNTLPRRDRGFFPTSRTNKHACNDNNNAGRIMNTLHTRT